VIGMSDARLGDNDICIETGVTCECIALDRDVDCENCPIYDLFNGGE
jgi:hypothetical protein